VGGSIADCTYVDGVVCRKNVAHKHMRCVIRNPKILFFSCALEYDPFEVDNFGWKFVFFTKVGVDMLIFFFWW
jgi:hypothetical protein